ncbi:MAG: hypothetical protein Q8Q20_02765 [bacterium]|nr:hypothetical protein [bacterium]
MIEAFHYRRRQHPVLFIFVFILALAVVLLGVGLFWASQYDLTTASIDAFDWKNSPFKVFFVSSENGNEVIISGIYTDGTGLEEIQSMPTSEWAHQQSQNMSGVLRSMDEYVGSGLSPDGEMNVTVSRDWMGQREFHITEEETNSTLIDGLVWPYLWFYRPERIYWLPDSRYLLVEDRGELFIARASDGQYARLTKGALPSLYPPE